MLADPMSSENKGDTRIQSTVYTRASVARFVGLLRFPKLSRFSKLLYVIEVR